MVEAVYQYTIIGLLMIKLSIELAYFATQFSPIEIKNTNRLDANLMTTAKAITNGRAKAIAKVTE